MAVYHRKTINLSRQDLVKLVYELEIKLHNKQRAHTREVNKYKSESDYWFNMYQGQVEINKRIKKDIAA